MIHVVHFVATRTGKKKQLEWTTPIHRTKTIGIPTSLYYYYYYYYYSS